MIDISDVIVHCTSKYAKYIFTCHVNNSNKYRFVMIAKIIIKIISKAENDFKMRTSNFAKLGRRFWINKPIPSGTIRQTAYIAILR